MFFLQVSAAAAAAAMSDALTKRGYTAHRLGKYIDRYNVRGWSKSKGGSGKGSKEEADETIEDVDKEKPEERQREQHAVFAHLPGTALSPERWLARIGRVGVEKQDLTAESESCKQPCRSSRNTYFVLNGFEHANSFVFLS